MALFYWDNPIAITSYENNHKNQFALKPCAYVLGHIIACRSSTTKNWPICLMKASQIVWGSRFRHIFWMVSWNSDSFLASWKKNAIF